MLDLWVCVSFVQDHPSEARDIYSTTFWMHYKYLIRLVSLFYLSLSHANHNGEKYKRELKTTCLIAEDRPDLICRVFKIMLDLMLKDFKKEEFYLIHSHKNHKPYFSYIHIKFCYSTRNLFIKNFYISIALFAFELKALNFELWLLHCVHMSVQLNLKNLASCMPKFCYI